VIQRVKTGVGFIVCEPFKTCTNNPYSTYLRIEILGMVLSQQFESSGFGIEGLKHSFENIEIPSV
jgi:hypothetical protein